MLKSSRLTGLAGPVLTSTHGAIAARTGAPAPIGVAQLCMAATGTTAHVRTIVPTASTGLGRSSKRARLPTMERAALMAWPYSHYGPQIVLSLAFVADHPAAGEWSAAVP